MIILNIYLILIIIKLFEKMKKFILAQICLVILYWIYCFCGVLTFSSYADSTYAIIACWILSFAHIITDIVIYYYHIRVYRQNIFIICVSIYTLYLIPFIVLHSIYNSQLLSEIRSGTENPNTYIQLYYVCIALYAISLINSFVKLISSRRVQ